MKLTFLLQLFVLGFFLEVVLTSPLVTRQGTQGLPGCPQGVNLMKCDIKQQVVPGVNSVPSTSCRGTAICKFSGPPNVALKPDVDLPANTVLSSE
ncbi:7893_t:CDS:2, partial [Cetraspora pellucida]